MLYTRLVYDITFVGHITTVHIFPSTVQICTSKSFWTEKGEGKLPNLRKKEFPLKGKLEREREREREREKASSTQRYVALR